METFNIQFITETPYAESLASTSSIKSWDANVWSWDASIEWDTEYLYTFNTNSFVIRNLGTATIDPRESNLRIQISGNFEGSLIMNNITTGDSFIYNGNLSENQVLELNRIKMTIGGVSILSKTNKKLITLKPGENQFVISGGQVSQVNFDFNFLYK